MKATTILDPSHEHFLLLSQQILQGNIVAIPTETVYGLAANVFDTQAISAIFHAKGRPQDNPFIVHICSMDMLYQVAKSPCSLALCLAKTFWPGPLTLILEKTEQLPLAVTGGLQTVGVRMPNHPAALTLIQTCGIPLAAPSANRSGSPSPTTAYHVKQDLEGKISYVLNGGCCTIGVESTVVRLVKDTIEILRPGSITKRQLETTGTTVVVHPSVSSPHTFTNPVISPGMKYRHYAPDATLTLVKGGIIDFTQYVFHPRSSISPSPKQKQGVLIFEQDQSLFVQKIPYFVYGDKNNAFTQANQLFDALRQIDQSDVTHVFARSPDLQEIGQAVYNRLLRACHFSIVDQQQLLVVGLTGPTGAGKSTLCTYWMDKNPKISLIDGDQLTHQLLYMPQVITLLTEQFGSSIQNQDHTINRKQLGALVFADEEKRKILTNILYPIIKEKIFKQLLQWRLEGRSIVILDAPTLFESGVDALCDQTVFVYASSSLRQERIIHRDHLSLKEASQRMNAQQKKDFYYKKCDHTLCNNGDTIYFYQQADQLMSSFEFLLHEA